MKKFLKFLVIVVLLFSSTACLNKKSDEKPQNEEKAKEEKKLGIVDLNSKSRPFAVMINNHPTARKNHMGLQDAYIIYEFIVEGGLTRYMALYKDQSTEKIGSVRSARHYFLDYAMENDAYFVHWGQSPQAQSDIKNLKIDAINGLVYEGKYFYRDKTLKVASEHTGFTSMEHLKNGATNLKFRSETDKNILLDYSVDEINLASIDSAEVANNIVIKYSASINNEYEYDAVNKIYKRSVNGSAHVDAVTKEQYTFKNIITYQVANGTISNDDKNRQELDNVGSGTGYFITNGYAVPITWTKTSRSAQTVYKYLDGKEIKVNDGNTFIQVQPKGQTLTIS